jgi:Na+-driven multidrug efflux pump
LIGLIGIFISLIVYIGIVLRYKQKFKKHLKWIYSFSILALGVSLMIPLELSLSVVIEYLNHTIGSFTKTVVL